MALLAIIVVTMCGTILALIIAAEVIDDVTKNPNGEVVIEREKRNNEAKEKRNKQTNNKKASNNLNKRTYN